MIAFISSWENQEAIDRNHQTSMMALREKYDPYMQIERFVSASEVPQKDMEFIRK